MYSFLNSKGLVIFFEIFLTESQIVLNSSLEPTLSPNPFAYVTLEYEWVSN